MALDSSTDIVLDADGTDIIFKDAGTTFATFTNSSTDLTIDAAGGNILSSDALNFGGAAAQAYNFFASDTSGASTPDGVADLYIQDELEVDGTTTFANLTYTWPTTQTANYILSTNGTGTLSWADLGTHVSNFWRQNTGALYPANTTVDLLVGGTTTTSAKFSVLNMNSGTPTASISANSGNNASFLTGGGNLGTANAQTLTLGGATTGDIVIDAGSGNVNLSDATASRFVLTDANKNLTYSGASSVLLNTLSDETGTGVSVFGTSPTITTSILTGSASFNVFNDTATTINAFGAATTLNLGATTGTAAICQSYS